MAHQGVRSGPLDDFESVITEKTKIFHSEVHFSSLSTGVRCHYPATDLQASYQNSTSN